MNATRVIKFTNTWGYFINGSWNGIVGHFVQGEADVGGTVMFINEARLGVVQFLCQPTTLNVDFVFREPPLSYNSNLFLLPFSSVVWMCIGALVMILTVITYVNAYWEAIKIKKHIMKSSNHTTLKPNISDIVVLLISAMCQQGSTIELKGGVGRLIMFLIFLSFLFLYTSYSASIVALLQSSSNSIHSLADLYNSKMELGVENLPYNIYYFTSAKDPLRKAIYENRVAPKGRKPNYLTLEEGVKKLQAKPFAFNMNVGVGYRLVNKYFLEHEKCGLQQINFIDNSQPFVACPKYSPYVEIFKVGLQRSVEHGLIDRINRIIFSKKPQCTNRGGQFISVNILDFYPILLMLLYGMVLSIVILLIEVVVHHKYTQICYKKARFISDLNSMEPPRMVRFMKTDLPSDDYTRREHLMLVADVNCPNIKTFFKQAGATKKLAFPYRWIIVGGTSNDSIVPSSVYSLNLLSDSEVIVSHRNDDYSFTLYMIYKMRINSNWVYEDCGIWTNVNGFKKSKILEHSIPTRRKNFEGNTIVTAMVILNNKTMSDPYDLRDILTDTVSKSGFRQTDALFFYLNATRQLVFSETWGYYRNGSYEGMVAEMTQGNAELSCTVLITTADRIEVVDYLSSPTPISIKFVFRQPPLSYQNNLFLLPFKTRVWYCIGAFILMLIFIIYVNASWEKKKLEQCKSEAVDHTMLTPNVNDTTMLVIAAITQQGSSIELKGTLGRLVMFLLFLAFLLLYSSYSASIVALLQSRSNQIRTLTDLLNSKLELGVEDTPYNRYFFPIATEPVRKAIYQTKIAPRGTKPKFMSLEEGVKKLQKEPFAFNMNKGIGYRLVDRYFHEHEKCGLQEIGYLYDTKTYITCRKNSPYRETFKIGLFRIQEHGLSDRENRLIYARKPACIARGGSFGSVNMVDFHPVVLMLLYGMALAFTLLLLEILVHKKQQQYWNRTQLHS
ncbi:ionotropic receptor 75a-like [Amyelois transitella]|uniref:ionotropic receptor 75a-like n=1 Tax=Amyelois transitella TaxID=680683 RepID=UPI00299075C2|nr:ionotropic receptor 75a-like [Amyelois transitella]